MASTRSFLVRLGRCCLGRNSSGWSRFVSLIVGLFGLRLGLLLVIGTAKIPDIISVEEVGDS